MDLQRLEKQLADSHAAYLRWSEPIDAYIRDNLSRVNVGGYTRADYDRGFQEVLAVANRDENVDCGLSPILDALCVEYPELDDEERELVRERITVHRGLPGRVEGYAITAVRKIVDGNDVWRLDRALVAMSIANCAEDYRDTLMSLTDIWVTAEDAGVDPRPHFARAARISSEIAPRGGSMPFARVLAEFQDSAILAEARS